MTVDGGAAQTVDLYSEDTLYQQSVWTSGTLSEGAHTLVIAWTGTKNPDSSGTTISVDAFDITAVPESGLVSTGVWANGTKQGETVVISEALAAEIAQRQVLRYAGYCYDSESGLYYLSARHYDPVTRQFLSKDLSRNDGEQSAYQYCLGNPVGLVDPTGLETRSFWEDVMPEEYAEDRRQAELARIEHNEAAADAMRPWADAFLNNGFYDTSKMAIPANAEDFKPHTITQARWEDAPQWLDWVIMYGSAGVEGQDYTEIVYVAYGVVYTYEPNTRRHAELNGISPGKYTQFDTVTLSGTGKRFLVENENTAGTLRGVGYDALGHANNTAQWTAVKSTALYDAKYAPFVWLALELYEGNTEEYAEHMAMTTQYKLGPTWVYMVPTDEYMQ